MPKVDIWKDERWPDYGMSRDEGDIEVSEEFLVRYDRVNAEYDAVQNEIVEILKLSRRENETQSQ